MVNVLRVDNSNYHKIKEYKGLCLFHYVLFRYKTGRKEIKEIEHKQTKEIYLIKEKKYHSAQLHEGSVYYILFYPDDKIDVLTEKGFNELDKDFKYCLIKDDDENLIKG